MFNVLAAKNQFALLSALEEITLEGCLSERRMKMTSYSKGTCIHLETDLCTSMEIILEGQVAVERIDETGYLMTITHFGPDEVLGANLIFSRRPHYPMTVSAKTDATLLSIEKTLVFSLCAENPEFLRVFLAYISDHTLVLGDKIKHFVNRSIRDSLIAFLKTEVAKQGTYTVVLPTSKKALADRIGIQRTSLSRELQKMKNEGLITYDATTITVTDPSVLNTQA